MKVFSSKIPTPEKTYEQVHHGVKYRFGEAKEYQCVACDKQAKQWCYQYTSSEELLDPEGRKYSLDVETYAPMCVGCHSRLDCASEPRIRAIRQAGGRLTASALAERYRTDPEFRSMRDRRIAEGLTAMREKDPEHHIRIGAKVGASLRARMLVDPKFAEEVAARGRASQAQRVACGTCGRVTSPAGLGSHQKHNSHEGSTQAADDLL